MVRVSFPLLVALVLLSWVPEARAIPNCGPGSRVEPSYDSNGEPQPGGTCVPIEEPPKPPPVVRPSLPLDAGIARKAPPFDARPEAPPPFDAQPASSPPAVPTPPNQPGPATEAPAEKKRGCGGCSSPAGEAGGLALLALAVLLATIGRRRAA